jgi:hypothetical protein
MLLIPADSLRSDSVIGCALRNKLNADRKHLKKAALIRSIRVGRCLFAVRRDY